MKINFKKKDNLIASPHERTYLESIYFRKWPDYLQNKFNSIGFYKKFESEVVWDEKQLYYKKPSFFARIFKLSPVFETESVFLQKKEKIERLIKRQISSIPVWGNVLFHENFDETLIVPGKEVNENDEDEKVTLQNTDLEGQQILEEFDKKDILSNQEYDENIEPFITQVKTSDIENEKLLEEEKKVEKIIEKVDIGVSQEELKEIIVQKEEVSELSKNSLDPQASEMDEDESIFQYAKAPLASNKEIEELEKQHIEFYNILALIQETHAPNDFKSAYNIQDRISYLLNHQTLLYKSLVSQLINYLKTINTKLRNYHDEITQKQIELRKYNSKISEIKDYKWKTDDSVDIIKENEKFIKEGLDESSKTVERAVNT